MHNIGTDFVWFMGVVEDRDDPLQMGRVRVRTHFQTADKNILPTNDLPWAQITVPSSASSGDIGNVSTGYVEGSWVVGFFMDGNHKQHPLILGAISGIPTKELDVERGFNDPRGVYPQRLNEPDMNRLVRTKTIREESEKLFRTEEETSANLHPSILFRDQYVDDLTGEPIPNRNSEYPYSHVKETESGHIEEWDDTLGSERIAVMHRTGSMREYHPDGSKVDRVMKDNYHIVYGDDYVRVRGVSKVYIDGDASLYVRGKLVTQVDGNMETYVSGNYNMDIGGNINITTNGSHKLEAKKDISQTTESTYISSSSGKMTFSTKDEYLVQSQNNFDINTNGEFRVRSKEVELHSSDGSITFYSSQAITGFYCKNSVWRKLCVFDFPSSISVSSVSNALILEPYVTKEYPGIFSDYSRKLDVGKGFENVYREDLGLTPGGKQTGTIPDDSGQDSSSISRYEIDITTTSEALTTSRIVGNDGQSELIEDVNAHGKDQPHVNVLDVALSAKNLGPHAWVDGDTKEGLIKYSNPGNPNIIRCIEDMGCLDIVKSINSVRYDQTAWCAAFVGAMLRRSGNKYLKTLSSRAYEENSSSIGTLISTTYEPDKMKPGDILVFGRSGESGKSFKNSPYGHVGFWTGNENLPSGKISCLGGNQSNRVTIRTYPVQKGNEFGLVAVIRPISGYDGKTYQPSPKIFRETVIN